MQNVIFNGSPRNDGNCDFVSKIILKSLGSGEIYPIAKANIAPCTACDYCATHYGQCALSKKDDNKKKMQVDQAHFYFQKLLEAKLVFFISPIYHYNVPAQLKAFLDRSQAWYHKPKNASHSLKKCGLILLGAREKGEKLFEGASLTFKYSMQSLGYSLVTPLCFYGIEHKNDLAQRKDFQKEIIKYINYYQELPLY